MMLVASYLLKVIACSGLLFLYYHLALRNKLFHQWNRFYLLSAAILSLIIPVVQITISHSMEEKGAPIQLLKVVESANSYLDDVTVGSHSAATPGTIALVVYAIISVFLLLSLIISLVKIISIAKRYGARVIMNVKFINTDVAGTPFSFFRYIFWNESIDLQSENGQRIFEHELVHVKEKHTIDKIMMEVLIILFWCNPFFWLMRQELKMIHEFIADQKAVGEHGAAAFAAMVLQASYSKQFHSITNQFFQTSIKRRLQMITKIQNPKLSYFSRIIALPIIAILVLAFTLRTKELSFIKLEKTFTVVVDAGHGFNPNGTPNGVRINDLTEDDLVLSISKKIQQLNPNENVKVILTRNNKDIIDLRERVSVAERANADLFISLHINADVPGTDNSGNSAYNSSRLEGMQIYVSNKQTPFQLQSETFGSILGKQLEPIYTVDPVLLRRKVGIWVLDKNVCPAVMLECGFLTNDKDRQFISKEENQKLIAEKVLSAIQQYAKAKEDGTLPVRPALIQNDTTPKQYYKGKEVISVNVNKQRQMIYITTKDGKIDSLTSEQAGKYNFNAHPPMYVVDGKEFYGDINSIDPKSIESVNVLKGESATKLYGDKGMYGVVVIKLKSKGEIQSTKENNKPNVTINDKSNSPKPMYMVDGKENADALETLKPEVIQSVNVLKGDAAEKKYGDKGKNGVIEITTKKAGAPVTDGTTTIPGVTHNDPDVNRIFEKTETPASIDLTEWRRFLSENLQPVIESVAGNGARPGSYTTQVKFIVETDGTLSNASIVKDPGYNLGKKVMEFIYKSPKWEPATQNGIKVRSYHTQPITFVISKQ